MDYGFGMMPSEKERSAQRLSLIRRMHGMNSMIAAERETSMRGGMGRSMTARPAPVEVGCTFPSTQLYTCILVTPSCR